MSLGTQVVWLFVLALPIAAISWTITHEEAFREPREFCKRCSNECAHLWQRKFFFLFTCEYCLSHYVAAIFLALTRFKLLDQDWRGYIIGGFALVWVANFYMGLYGLLRLDLKKEREVISEIERKNGSSKRAA